MSSINRQTMMVLVPSRNHWRASSVYRSSVAISARAWYRYGLGLSFVAFSPYKYRNEEGSYLPRQIKCLPLRMFHRKPCIELLVLGLPRNNKNSEETNGLFIM